MSLFQWGDFTLHSGEKSWWRIDCDDLTDSEIALFAKLIRERAGMFHHAACPVSHYGSAAPRLVRALSTYRSDWLGRGNFVCLIVDDVLTTGASMEEVKAKEGAARSLPSGKKTEFWGAVLFARGPCPDWITPIFQLVQ